MKKKAELILSNRDLFSEYNKTVAAPALDIAKKIIDNPDYKISEKQYFHLNRAYNHLLPMVLEKQEKIQKFNKLDKIDQLWETYSSSFWVDDEGPSDSMNYGQFLNLMEKVNDEINELKKENKKLKQQLDK